MFSFSLPRSSPFCLDPSPRLFPPSTAISSSSPFFPGPVALLLFPSSPGRRRRCPLGARYPIRRPWSPPFRPTVPPRNISAASCLAARLPRDSLNLQFQAASNATTTTGRPLPLYILHIINYQSLSLPFPAASRPASHRIFVCGHGCGASRTKPLRDSSKFRRATACYRANRAGHGISRTNFIDSTTALVGRLSYKGFSFVFAISVSRETEHAPLRPVEIY